MYMLHREKAFSNMNVCVFLNELEEAPERPWVGLFLVSEKKKGALSTKIIRLCHLLTLHSSSLCQKITIEGVV